MRARMIKGDRRENTPLKMIRAQALGPVIMAERIRSLIARVKEERLVMGSELLCLLFLSSEALKVEVWEAYKDDEELVRRLPWSAHRGDMIPTNRWMTKALKAERAKIFNHLGGGPCPERRREHQTRESNQQGEREQPSHEDLQWARFRARAVGRGPQLASVVSQAQDAPLRLSEIHDLSI